MSKPESSPLTKARDRAIMATSPLVSPLIWAPVAVLPFYEFFRHTGNGNSVTLTIVWVLIETALASIFAVSLTSFWRWAVSRARRRELAHLPVHEFDPSVKFWREGDEVSLRAPSKDDGLGYYTFVGFKDGRTAVFKRGTIAYQFCLQAVAEYENEDAERRQAAAEKELLVEEARSSAYNAALLRMAEEAARSRELLARIAAGDSLVEAELDAELAEAMEEAEGGTPYYYYPSSTTSPCSKRPSCPTSTA